MLRANRGSQLRRSSFRENRTRILLLKKIPMKLFPYKFSKSPKENLVMF